MRLFHPSSRLYRAVSLWGGPGAWALTSNHCFIIHTGVLTKRWILLYLLSALVNNHDYCHTTRILTLFLFLSQCSVLAFLSLLAHHTTCLSISSSTPNHLFLLFTSFKGWEGIPAAKVVFSRQCSTGIWLIFLIFFFGQGAAWIERLGFCMWLRRGPWLGQRFGDMARE